MKLPWKGGKAALVAAAGEDRLFQFFLLCVTTLGTVGFNFLSPQIIRYTIDSVIGNSPLEAPAFVIGLVQILGGIEVLRRNIWISAVFILLAAVVSAIFNKIRRYYSIEIGETVAWRMRNTLYSHIQKLPFDWHVGCHTGDIIQRCTSDVDNIRNFIQNQLSEFIRTVWVLVIALLMMFSMDVFMSLTALILIPIILVFSIFYFRKVSKQFDRGDIAEGIMQAAAQENYTGVRVVRAFGRESFEMDKFSEKTKNYQDIWINIGKMLGTFWGAGDFFSGFQLVIIVGAGVWRSVHGQLSPGTFLAFYTYCNWMIWPVRNLGHILSDLSRTMVASGRVRDILSVEPETDPPDSLEPELKGNIRFDNVSFNYGKGEPVLKNVSFSLKPGESLAILGSTGSGKSTLVHLLSRLYDLKDGDGSITIDGIDIRRIARPVLRRQIGLCLQEPFLFSKTIRENISTVKPEMEFAELRSAAAVAMVDETIEGFAEGYNTVIGERGVTLSGGQKQRVAIARMLAGNAPVMVFDDSLSAVDTETDARIRAALRHRVTNAAVIIISHRISTLMQADKILVLKDGMVEDLGTHGELMKRDGSYRRIYELQRGVVIHDGSNGAEGQDGE
ncbi:MAG: ABC transporter ATP-binding protein/permease [Treponema sp.]|nr:ABC transporter ATP-binding protein/permease [Treponema sp.]